MFYTLVGFIKSEICWLFAVIHAEALMEDKNWCLHIYHVGLLRTVPLNTEVILVGFSETFIWMLPLFICSDGPNEKPNNQNKVRCVCKALDELTNTLL